MEAAEKFDQKKKKSKRKNTLIDYLERQKHALNDAKVKSIIDFDLKDSGSIKSLTIEKKY